MPFYTENIETTDGALNLLRDLVHERTGLAYGNGRGDLLADKLAPLIVARGFDSLLDYYYLLRYDEAESAAEWRRVHDALSVPETFFWREMDQVHAFVNEVVPQHFSRAGAGPLRLWSVPCSTGEEPLTIALALNEAGWFGRGAFELNAGELSPAALARARGGLYRERSFRSLPGHLREKYFTREGEMWRIAPELHARVSWNTVNLNDTAQVERLAAGANVIFCRNVFIYFSEQAISRTVRAFHRGLSTPGHLFIAAAESLLKLTTDFELREVGGAFVYIKR